MTTLAKIERKGYKVICHYGNRKVTIRKKKDGFADGPEQTYKNATAAYKAIKTN